MSEIESKLAKLEGDLEKLRGDMARTMKEALVESVKTTAEYIVTVLTAVIECARSESSLRDKISDLQPGIPHEYAVDFIKFSLRNVKNILSEGDSLEENLQKFGGKDVAKEIRSAVEEDFSVTIKWALHCLMSYNKDTISFDEFLSLIVDAIGAENVKKLLTPEDVLRAYGIQECAKYKDFLSK